MNTGSWGTSTGTRTMNTINTPMTARSRPASPTPTGTFTRACDTTIGIIRISTTDMITDAAQVGEADAGRELSALSQFEPTNCRRDEELSRAPR